jgi:hypothetical protein
MTSNTIFLAGLALFDGLAVAWGIWEFWSARPTKKAAIEDSHPMPRRSSESSGHPER